MSKWRIFDREFFVIGGIVLGVMSALAAIGILAAKHESKYEAARWAQLYTLTADGRTWHDVHYVQQWRRTITVETQGGQRITVCEPYVIETQTKPEAQP